MIADSPARVNICIRTRIEQWVALRDLAQKRELEYRGKPNIGQAAIFAIDAGLQALEASATEKASE